MNQQDRTRERLHGVVTATPTTFAAGGDLDEGRFRALVEGYVAAGVHGISVAGSQGEFYVLDTAERLRLMEITVETVAGRVPVYAGTGAVSTRESIALTRAAESIGVDVAMVITPYFLAPSGRELAEHFRTVAAATALPVLLYNNPPRTGVNVTPDVYADCARSGNVIGVKDSSGDLSQGVEFLLTEPGGCLLFSGRDTITMALLAHGGAGAISPAANVFPRLVCRMYDAVRAGDLATARRINDALAPLRRAWALGSFPVVIKEAMAVVGLDPGPARAPISPLPPERRARLTAVVEGIREFERDAVPAISGA
ncbi:4-hydroxy-tetrahydrodipicolinate synthase [Actinomadura sp. KC216]|uniref:4-hydroxy-tetrahydrodipicolinate synthase n=1 Tax=Actinomadura sp. KC216 TaxID=2530370 RepID=UPI00104FA758|nr:4-hydroxy-tetrahydrodipicolinate synthase [Actinomadura sp. KC216]TDB77924.1 4-hydroxy-tetrahydrodipicolinate synthase [Actinomadura sp. KC216]